ncbi:MAG TPA: universal stress protein [Candidatus Binatia bacterium]|nr:universal stress protein [Candidatus Binatia bacterium]
MPLVRPGTAVSFKNILFLTDFGPASSGALAYALAFARHFKARFYPAHVMKTVSAASGTPAASMQDLEGQKHSQLSRLAEFNGLHFQPLLSRCDFETALSHWIAEHGIDLVVAGTHGRRGAQRLLLGSTCELVLENAPCPVLTVGPNVDVPRLFSLTLQNILLPTDLGAQSKHVLGYALALAQEQCARLMMLHVLPEESRNYPDRSRVLSFALKEMEEMLPAQAERGCKPEFAVDAGSTAERIVMHAQSEHADLIVMGRASHEHPGLRGGFGITQKVICAAPGPVLSVPDAWKQ